MPPAPDASPYAYASPPAFPAGISGGRISKQIAKSTPEMRKQSQRCYLRRWRAGAAVPQPPPAVRTVAVARPSPAISPRAPPRSLALDCCRSLGARVVCTGVSLCAVRLYRVPAEPCEWLDKFWSRTIPRGKRRRALNPQMRVLGSYRVPPARKAFVHIQRLSA
jgi:hypothetical protein